MTGTWRQTEKVNRGFTFTAHITFAFLRMEENNKLIQLSGISIGITVHKRKMLHKYTCPKSQIIVLWSLSTPYLLQTGSFLDL